MAYVLLLYDTLEKELARDIKEFLIEIGVENLKMIPMEPDRGLTLQDKEAHYIESAIGAIFIITPGSERLGKLFPSPSVTEEMGQAKQKFEKYPERIIYWVDKRCNLQSIDQRSYIPFDRDDIRSITEAFTLLVKNLKHSGLLMIGQKEPLKTPQIDIPELIKSIGTLLTKICVDLSKVPNGAMGNNKFDQHLKDEYLMTDQNINLVKRDLLSKNLVTLRTSQSPFGISANWWVLSDLGWEIVRNTTPPFERELSLAMNRALESVKKKLRERSD